MSSTLQQFHYTSVLQQRKAEEAIFSKTSSFSRKVWQHMGPFKKGIAEKVGVAEKQTETNKVTDTTSIRTFFLQNR